MTVIGWIILGAIGGWLGGVLVKGDERFGVLGHIVIGIIGAALAGWVVTLITKEDPMDGVFDISSLVTAIVGAVVLVILVNAIQGRTRTGSGPI
jgi:uncharacterized membrane protein YeaQ/YmgE (transglycosylase-associated protein family)